MADKMFITIAETADYLGIPKSRVYALANSGNLPAVKMGKSWFINKDQLNTWAVKIVNKPSRQISA